MKSAFIRLSVFHLGLAVLTALGLLYLFRSDLGLPCLMLIGLPLVFMAGQLKALRLVQTGGRMQSAVWVMILTLLVCILAVSGLVRNAVFAGLLFLFSIPLFVVAVGELKALPKVLLLTFLVSAGAMMLDLGLSQESWRIHIVPLAWYVSGGVFFVYLVILAVMGYSRSRDKGIQINVATQYALVITIISAMAVILVTGVMIRQIRTSQINQVGKSFQTVAENFAKLVGAQIEQQTQKLQLLTQQVPVFKKELLRINSQYPDKTSARQILAQNQAKWQNPDKNRAFTMAHLDNPLVRAMSLFRGHNSFHRDLVLVDGYGGLAGSLGQKPGQYLFYEENWWLVAWNKGLGNTFIGDHSMAVRVPEIRIAVAVVDHGTNKVIGVLSSMYLLRTLLEDLRRFKPDIVDQISLIGADGHLIVTTVDSPMAPSVWRRLNASVNAMNGSGSGWMLGQDHLDQAALIGFSSLSTAYSVISDPLHRLGWQIIVSGSRSSALFGVTQSTKLAILAGLVVTALGVVGAIAAARVITRPLEDLTETASAMGEGKLDMRARLTGPEELRALSSGFNQLTDRLRRVIQNLRSQARQLARAKKEAEAATRLKSEFLAKMSHEIRTPLNAILGFADILAASSLDRGQKRHVRIIKSSGTDLLHLINDILDLSKIEAGQMELKTGPVRLRALFEELYRIFSISAQEKMIRVTMDVAPQVPDQLLLDRVRLRQVLFNLIGNAVKFTDKGEVVCSARAVPVPGKDRWNLEIDVRDTGIGIDPDACSRIFDAFKQYRGEAHQTLEGTGLGLAISKNLVEIMGGDITVKSEKGQGTVFSIILSGVAVTDARIPDTALTETPGQKDVLFAPSTLLVADDLEVNRQLITAALAAYPFDIVEVTDGKEAVDLAAGQRFDLILMDIWMPEMDGYRALEKIRQFSKGGDVPVIAITAAGMKEDIQRIREAGFDDFLIRPFDKSALLGVIGNYISHGQPVLEPETADQSRPLAKTGVPPDLLWTCPPEAVQLITRTLPDQWESVVIKQSIPEIMAFATRVQSAGERFKIPVLACFGKELLEYAEAFDVHHIEKLLKLFEKIMEGRVDKDEERHAHDRE